MSAPLNFDRWTTIRSVRIQKKKITSITGHGAHFLRTYTGQKNEEKCAEYEEKRRQFDTRALNLTHRFIKISVKKRKTNKKIKQCETVMRDISEHSRSPIR